MMGLRLHGWTLDHTNCGAQYLKGKDYCRNNYAPCCVGRSGDTSKTTINNLDCTFRKKKKKNKQTNKQTTTTTTWIALQSFVVIFFYMT